MWPALEVIGVGVELESGCSLGVRVIQKKDLSPACCFSCQKRSFSGVLSQPQARRWWRRSSRSEEEERLIGVREQVIIKYVFYRGGG